MKNLSPASNKCDGGGGGGRGDGGGGGGGGRGAGAILTCVQASKFDGGHN